MRNDGSLFGLHLSFSVAFFVAQPLDCLLQFYMFWSSRNVVILVGVFTYVLWFGKIHLRVAAQLVSFQVIVHVFTHACVIVCASVCVGMHVCLQIHAECILHNDSYMM